jgi:hypothetical protein
MTQIRKKTIWRNTGVGRRSRITKTSLRRNGKALSIKIWLWKLVLRSLLGVQIASDEAELLLFFNIKEIDYYISLISFCE